MTAKEYLSLAKQYEMMISDYTAEIQRLSDVATSITQTAKADVVQTSGSQQKMADAVTEIVHYQEQIQKTTDEMIAHRDAIRKQINSIGKQQYRDILWHRYMEHKTFEQIAVDLDLSWRHTIRLHGAALKVFGEKYRKKIEKCHCLSY